MYQATGLLTGIIIAVMVAINGGLTEQYGVFLAAVIIHIVGTIFALLLIRGMKKKVVLSRNWPVWLYSGGLIGVLTTVFNNFAFGKISLTGIVALGLFGQTAASLLIDRFGLFGMEKCPFRKSSLIGLSFSAAGIIIMLNHLAGAALYAVFLSFGAGVTIVLSRTVNAELSKHTGELQGSFINHAVGLAAAILFFAVLGREELRAYRLAFSPEIWIYLGGSFGVVTVLLCNITVPRVPALQLTLLTFVGQVFTGIVIDVMTKSGYTEETFMGGLLVAAGIAANLLVEYVGKRKKKVGG